MASKTKKSASKSKANAKKVAKKPKAKVDAKTAKAKPRAVSKAKPNAKAKPKANAKNASADGTKASKTQAKNKKNKTRASLSRDILKAAGKPSQHQAFDAAEIADLYKRLPSDVADVLADLGRGVFHDGLLQTCHPEDLEGVLQLVFEGDKDFSAKNCHVFAHSAFGALSFWMKDYGFGTVDLYRGIVQQDDYVEKKKVTSSGGPPYQLAVPFLLSVESHDAVDEKGKPLFARATKKLGKIQIGECFGFALALPFGGGSNLEDLRRLSAFEHFAIVAQAEGFALIYPEDTGELRKVRDIGR